MITGFVISFAAIIFNASILTNINGRIGALDSENLRLNDALREQLANGNEAEAKYDDFLLAKSIADNSAPAAQEGAQVAASILMNEALTYLFAAANDVPMLEIRRIESEEANSEEMQKLYEEAKEQSRNPPKAESKKSSKDQESEAPPPDAKSDERKLEEAQNEIARFDIEADYANLPQKIAALETISDAVAASKNQTEMALKLFPVNKALNSKWLETVKVRQLRIGELSGRKSEMLRYQSYSTFIALSLQMLGLMIVVVKDVRKSRED